MILAKEPGHRLLGLLGRISSLLEKDAGAEMVTSSAGPCCMDKRQPSWSHEEINPTTTTPSRERWKETGPLEILSSLPL
jgi:hypothetical protein